jgi:hypothetical protein
MGQMARISISAKFSARIFISVPFLEAMIVAKNMKCTSFPNLALSAPILYSILMNVFAMFNSICLRQSMTDRDQRDIDSTLNSYLIPYLFHIFCVFFVFVVVFCILVLIYSIM